MRDIDSTDMSDKDYRYIDPTVTRYTDSTDLRGTDSTDTRDTNSTDTNEKAKDANRFTASYCLSHRCESVAL